MPAQTSSSYSDTAPTPVYPYRVPVTLFLQTKSSRADGDILEGWSYDLSPTGLSIIVERQLHDRTILALVDLNGELSVLRPMDVVRSRQLGEHAWEYGLSFTLAPEPIPEQAIVHTANKIVA